MNDINYYKKYEPIDGKWYLEKELGRGAFGCVFQAVRNDFGEQRSAIKMVSIPSSQGELDSFKQEHYELDDNSVTSYFYGFVEEFVKEFQLMATLKGHSNIVSYEDHDVRKKADEFGWDIFIRMELLTPMTEYFKNTAPTEKDIIKVGIDICRALEVCKSHNIIHRDIKPANIFISKDGNYKLGDFGVARTLEKTSSGLSKKGTYIYMAPEVYKGLSYNHTVDLYSLGILMYRQLNDNFEPFRTSLNYSDGETAMERRMNGEAFTAPKHASAALAKVILKACAYNPKDRFASATEMREALEAVAEGKPLPGESAAAPTLFCTNCGNTCKPGQNFCTKCNAPLTEAAKNQVAERERLRRAEEERQRKAAEEQKKKELEKTLSAASASHKIDKNGQYVDANGKVVGGVYSDKVKPASAPPAKKHNKFLSLIFLIPGLVLAAVAGYIFTVNDMMSSNVYLDVLLSFVLFVAPAAASLLNGIIWLCSKKKPETLLIVGLYLAAILTVVGFHVFFAVIIRLG